MSQYIYEKLEYKWVFGWDHSLLTFFLQKHDKLRAEEDQIIVWEGTKPREIYEVSDLVKVANRNGLRITAALQMKLYRDKDDGDNAPVFENVPVQINLGFDRSPDNVIGWASAFRDPISKRIAITIMMDDEASVKMGDLTKVLDIMAIGFAGLIKKPTNAG